MVFSIVYAAIAKLRLTMPPTTRQQEISRTWDVANKFGRATHRVHNPQQEGVSSASSVSSSGGSTWPQPRRSAARTNPRKTQ